MAESINIFVEHNEGDEVYFKQDQEKMWVVVGYEVTGTNVTYMVSTPEHGVTYATQHELITERTFY